jgi:acetate kinase
MVGKSLILVVNPGSASRKYALFAGDNKLANIHFEFENGKVVGKIEYDGQQQSKTYDDIDLSHVSRYVLPLMCEYGVIGDTDKITAIGIRLVAPGMRFTKDELVTDELKAALAAEQTEAPLHITVLLSEIEQLKNCFPDTPIVTVSDSAFHVTIPASAWYYGFDVVLADKLGIKRYGYHGISVSSVIGQLKNSGTLMPKIIVCHLGSGSSVTAVQDGNSVDTTMGYSPLEGLMMSTRSGNLNVSAALMIKRELQLTDDGLEQYLDKKSGLLGVSGSSDDIRQLLISEEQGDSRAELALNIFVYRVQQAIGQMAASLNGVDCLIFTATVGERSSIIRGRVLESLGYLGFVYDQNINNKTSEPSEAVNIATASSKPVFVISTDEAAEIAHHAGQYIVDHR